MNRKLLTELAGGLPNVLSVRGPEWSTPLTGHRPSRRGDIRLHPISYPLGLYPLEGTNGFDYYLVTEGRMPVMILQQFDSPRNSKQSIIGRWSDWMIDDPLHWFAMAARVAQLPPGRILCAGLGLGLMVHHLVRRSDVTEITVVERNPNVVKLIEPTLPVDPRVRILVADYYDYIMLPEARRDPPDGILWDLAVGDADEARSDLILGSAVTTFALPMSKLYCFGLKDRPHWLAAKEA